ncbi:hypothetical protein JI739_00750 [Ramlibacter sp. AW1]|uniref:Uncharacterized protein n=1 Tax=Ramlibacter aurantiacus TaxID=2801330 RepID=A0A936ZKB9_9BURK|nr:hypothetical protein [Ramlibacter aurantiacus]MBL0418863.1 hypothetical protein [Ramlibacter aurantiacus]
MHLTRTGSWAGHHLGHRAAPLRNPRRGYVGEPVLRALEGTPIGLASRKAFRIQRFADCVHNTTRMTGQMVESLATMKQLGCVRTAWLRPHPHFLTELGEAPTAERLEQLGTLRGPLQLVSFHGLQPGQGEQDYRHIHAVVQVATLRHGGRTLGVLLDGNNYQSNPAIQALADLRKAEAGWRRLPDLDEADLLAADRAIQARRPGAPRVHQLAYRLVDLAQMLAASTSTAPALVRFNPGWEMVRPALSPHAADQLRAAVDADPSQVESFAPPANGGTSRPLSWQPLIDGL